jgi:hypothetical protein
MKGARTMKKICLAAALSLFALSVFAYDLTDTGFTQTGERSEDGKTIAVLADESGGEVLFDAETEPSGDRLSALRSLVAEIRSWEAFQPAEIRAVNMADRLQVSAIPRSFVVDGVALEQALPGGIQLLYKTATEYDFKVKSGKYVVRVSSVFTGLPELEAAALAAFKDPASFIATRDPLYVQKRLDELLDKVADFESRIATIEQANKELLSNEAKAKPAILAALNGGRPIREDALAKLIELKRQDPALDKKNAPAALRAAGYVLSLSEISAIYLVEFGER